MFLNKNNKIKWKLLLIAAAVVVVAIVSGMLWWDKPVYLFLRNFDWQIWQIFDVIFASKNWLIVSFLILMFFYIKNSEKSATKESFFVRNLNKVKKTAKKIVKTIGNPADFKKNFDLQNSALFCLSVFSAVITTGILKVVIGRMRPVFFDSLDKTGFAPFTNEWVFGSMPSGHASASFAGLVMIGMLYPKIKWLTWTIAIVIGVSRICVGDHWPTDIILGAFIGMVMADFIAALRHKK